MADNSFVEPNNFEYSKKTFYKKQMLKTGEYIKFNGSTYLFLGYSEYKRNLGIIADSHGNKAVVHTSQLSSINKTLIFLYLKKYFRVFQNIFLKLGQIVK